MTYAVVARGLTRRFGPHVALDAVDLDIREGEIFGLVGPNGAGKTTLIRILCAILGFEGSVSVLGFDVAREPERIRPHVGYMSQAFSLYQSLTIAENLQFFGDLYGRVPTDREHDVCAMVGLGELDMRHIVADLPTGVRQRAALASAIMHQPQLVFLDEPTSGVDPAGRQDFWDLIRVIAGDGTTVIVSTHVMTEAARCGRVALMLDGRMIACSSPQELMACTGLQIAVVEARPWQLAYEQLSRQFEGTSLRGKTIHVPLPQGNDVSTQFDAALAGVEVVGIATAEPTFEDAFMWLVRDSTVLDGESG